MYQISLFLLCWKILNESLCPLCRLPVLFFDINVNPCGKSPIFKLWDELHGGLRSKRRQAFSLPGGKPRSSCRGGRTLSVRGRFFYYNKSRIFGEFIIFAYALSNDNFLVSNNFRNSCKYTCGWLQFALLIQYLLSYLQLQLYFKYICGKSLD